MTVIRTDSLRLGLTLHNRGEGDILGHDGLRRGQLLRPVLYRRRRARPSSNPAVVRRLLGFKFETTAVIRISYCIRLPFLLQSDDFGLQIRIYCSQTDIAYAAHRNAPAHGNLPSCSMNVS